MREKVSLTEGSIIKGLMLFFFPILLGSLIQQLYTTADAMIVGQFVGKSGLAAVDSVNTLLRFPINFMNGLSAGATILISRFYGAGDRKELHYSIRSALIIGLVLGIAFSLGGVILTWELMKIMRVPAEILPETLLYTRIYFAGLWGMVLYNMTAGILRAFGDSRRPLMALVLSSLLNIAGDLILVGWMGMGVAGAAAATTMAQIISALVVLRMLAGSERAGGQIKIRHLHFYPEYMKSMIGKGFPLAIQSVLFPIANSIVQASVNGMGTNAIAAWGLADKLDFLIWLVADSMGPVLTTFVAQNLGAQKKERIQKGTITATAISMLLVALISLGLYFFAIPLGHLFVKEQDAEILLPQMASYLRTMAPFFVFYAMGEALSGACCGSGETLKPMVTTLLSICLLRVFCIFVILPAFQTMECIVWIYIASWIAVGISFLILWRKK